MHDPGNAHSVPYMHGINGFAYNVDMIKARMPNAPIGSLDMIFKPEIVSKFADCGVTFLDSAADTLMLALKYLGLDPNTTKREDYKAAEELLLKVRPYVRSFDSAEYLNGLANREICVAMSWSSDYALSKARARAVGVDVNLAFTVPKEGSEPELHLPVDSQGRAASGSGLPVHRFHAAARGDRGDHERDLLRERQYRVAPLD